VRWTAAEAYEALAPAVVGYLRGHGVRDPADLAGDVFVSVARGIAGFDGDANALRRWVFTIAHHRLVDEWRRASRDRHILMSEPPDTVAVTDPHDDAELLDALGDLTADQRDVVVLRFIGDLPLRDVARILGKRVGAVKMLQARGLEQLRLCLDRVRT
jgi:RNA polymerase sigma-70 factor, ECF subfamily